MGWQWKRLDENRRDARVERQLHEFGCGAACAVMLLADRGIQVDQLVVSAELHLPCSAQELARRLNALSGPVYQWLGGQLDLDPPLERAHLDALGARSSWAAQLIPTGARHGHWVVVDTLGADGTIAVRDPAGTSYRMAEREFLALMRYMVVVFETGGAR